MDVFHPAQFIAERPWGALDIEVMSTASIRLHWTDQPYIWHVNDGPEIFVVLDGLVDMHVRRDGHVDIHRLEPGHLARIGIGEEHVAVPIGEARILVIERAGSL